MLPFGVLGVFLVGDAQVQISEIEELFNGLNEIATSFISSLFLITILEIILRCSAAMISIIAFEKKKSSK